MSTNWTADSGITADSGLTADSGSGSTPSSFIPGLLIDPIVNIPISIEQGDSPGWIDQPFTDDIGNTYDASVYTLTYTLVGATGPLQLVGAETGIGWTLSLSTSQSASLTPGKYWWQATLSTTNGFALTVARGEVRIIANLALQVAGYSGLSLAEQNYNAARAQLAAATSTESYKIATREMKYRQIADILAAISYWNAEVINERTTNSIRQNQGNPRKMYARFRGGRQDGWF